MIRKCFQISVQALLISLIWTTCVDAQNDEAATRQYAVAVGFQKNKLYDQAIDEWQIFIKKFPSDKRQGFAHHYVGTCHLQAGQYDDAIKAFNSVLVKFSKFELMDATVLNLGFGYYNRAQESKKDADYRQAVRVFTTFLTDHSKSKYVPRALFHRGESYYQLKQLESAASDYSLLIRTHSDAEHVPDAYYALGVTQESLKKNVQAEATYSAFAKKFPRHVLANEVRYRQGEMLFAQKKYSQAKSLFADVSSVKGFKLADTAMMRQARCLYEEGSYDDAAKLYWSIPRQFEGTKLYDAVVLAGAKCYYMQEKYSVARSGLELISNRDAPEAVEALHWLARTWLKEDNTQKALAVVDNAIKRFANSNSPHLPQLLLTRADTLYEVPARRAETVKLYADFATNYPQHELAGQAQYMAALTSLEVGQHATSKALSDRFLSTFSNHKLTPDVQFIAAECRLLSEEYAEAEKRYVQFLKNAPRHESAEQARVRLGLTLQLQDKHTEVIAFLRPVASTLKSAELRSEAHYLIGRSHLEKKNFDNAAKSLEQSLRSKPDRAQSDETMLALVRAYQQSGRQDDAKKQLATIIDKYPNSKRLDEALYRLGESAYNAGEFGDAIAQYKQVLAKWPTGSFAPHAQYGIGWSLFGASDFQGAVKAMGELIRRYPKSEVTMRAFYVRAMAYQQQDQFTQAVTDLETFLASKPKKLDTLDALYVLALCQSGMQKFQAAADTLRAILVSEPDYVSADKVAYELGWALLELGKQKESVAAFQKLAKDHPNSPLAAESLFRVGEAYYDSGDYDQATTVYLQSQEKAGATNLGEKAIHKLAWCYLKQDKYDKASETFLSQIKTVPNGEMAADATFLVGECNFKQKKWADALNWFGKSVATGSEQYHALALFRSGECAAALEKWDASQRFHSQVLTPQFAEFAQRPEARYGLGWAHHQQGSFDLAIAQYEKVTEETQTETAAKARFMIGEIHFARKQHKEAIKHFLRTAFGYGHKEWSALGYFEAGRCFEVIKDVPKAIAQYKEMIKKYPKHAKVDTARQRIAALGG